MTDLEKQAGAFGAGERNNPNGMTIPSSPTSSNNSQDPSRSGEQHGSMVRLIRTLSSHRNAWTRLVQLVSKKAETTTSDDLDHSLDIAAEPNNEMTVRSLKNFPRGYPNLATFVDSDESFGVYRRFGYLQSRILLERQQQLQGLETELDQLDTNEMYDDPDKLFTRKLQGDRRRELLRSIELSFREYSSLLVAAKDLTALNKPTSSEHCSVVNYIKGVGPVEPQETKYVWCKEDLVSLRPGRENAWLDHCIEWILRVFGCRLLKRIFCSKELRRKAFDEEQQVYYSKDRVNACSTTIIIIAVLFLLIIPIYLLLHLLERNEGPLSHRMNALCIGILLIFTLTFTAMMSLFTAARKHEILGAVAAYCAVLVVFLGNIGNGNA